MMCGRAQAQPGSSPTAYEQFKATIEFAALDCDIEARTARVQLEFNTGPGRKAALAAWTKCVNAAKSSAGKALQPALMQFQQNPKAQGLLKEYHALWLDHLASTGLELGKSDLTRSLRIEASGLAAEKARTRLEHEAGLN